MYMTSVEKRRVEGPFSLLFHSLRGEVKFCLIWLYERQEKIYFQQRMPSTATRIANLTDPNLPTKL